VLEADEEVTIFFRAGVFPDNGISVGLQDHAVKILRVPYFSECYAAGLDGVGWFSFFHFSLYD
jgi:hypothetical protein